MDLRAPQTSQGEAQPAGNSGFWPLRGIGSFAALPMGKAHLFEQLGGHLLRYALSKLSELFLHTRALHLTASRLAETVACSLTEYSFYVRSLGSRTNRHIFGCWLAFAKADDEGRRI